MNIKKTIIAIVTAGAIFGIGASVLAAGPGKGPHKGHRFDVDKKVEKMTEHLELDAKQAEKIRTILKRSKADVEAARASEEERSVKRQEVRAIRESARAEIDAVLTPAQREKAETHRAKMKERHKEMRHRRGAKMMKGMKKKLDLSDDQVAQIKEIRKEARSEMRTIVQDEFGGDRKAANEALVARRQKMVSDIEGVLTPEQVTKFAELREERHERRGKRGKGHHRQGKSE